MSRAGYIPKQGDVIGFGLGQGSARESRVVLSPSLYNKRSGFMLSAPVTHYLKGYPFEVPIPSGQKIAGAILADQLTSMTWKDKRVDFLCRLPRPTLREVLNKAARLLTCVDEEMHL